MRCSLLSNRPGRILGLALGWLLLTAGMAPGDEPGILKTLRYDHPRLYLPDSDLPALRALVRTDATVKGWYESLRRSARKIQDAPSVEHKLVGPRLLSQSRAALDRVATLALLYRLDGDRRDFERARRELLTAAAFPDWNPKHFLDTAEMTHALGLGYDWLYRDLARDDRAKIRRAIVEMGLKPGLAVYRSGKGWPLAVHNWNQVCNGGLTVGALAVADEEPEIAAETIEHARRSIVRAMKTFAPDGGWPEGPGYWNYATRYNVFFLDAVGTALATDFGLLKLPGVAETGRFRIHSVGPTGLVFNYADGGESAGRSAQMLWLARTFRRPQFAESEADRVGDRPDAFHLIYAPGSIPPRPTEEAEPLDAFFRGVQVTFLRGAWDDPKAVYVGFKGGDNKANHSHLDLGSFVLDADGHRWATDLGGDNYNLPGYFGKQRWEIFRLRTESHNTLAVNGRNQDPRAAAPVIAFGSSPTRSFAVSDLSAAYRPDLRSARRGIALLDRHAVLVQDEVTADRAAGITWKMHTRAKIDPKGDHARLTISNAALNARILEPAGARFEVVTAEAPPPQARQPDVHALTVRIRLEQPGQKLRLAVLLEPERPNDGPRAVTVTPLDRWGSSR